MGDIAASDVTVTCPPTDRGRLNSRFKLNFVTLAFGNGVLTVPAAGAIPLPAKGFFGMTTFIKAIIVIAGDGPYKFVYDRANHTLIAHHADYDAVADGALIPAAAVAIAAQSLEAIVIGS